MTESVFRISDSDAYDDWIAHYDAPYARRVCESAEQACAKMGVEPSFAIAPIAFGAVAPDALSAFADRLRDQAYRRWIILEAQGEPRDMIARAAKAADFVLPLPLDAALAPHALAAFALALAKAPQAEMLYADEDFLSAGRRCRPLFKTDWDPYLILGRHYVGTPAAYRASRLARIAGENLSCASVDNFLHDLTLRYADGLAEDAILHVPAILCHRSARSDWQASEGRRVVEAHLAARGVEGAIVRPAPRAPDLNRITFPLPDPAPLVSIIVPTRDRADLLGPCVDGILQRTDYPSIELVIIDNGSTEADTLALFDALRADARVIITRDDRPFNFSQLMNEAVRAARGDIILLLNNDTEVLHPDWLRELAALASRPEIGVVGARLLYPDRRIQHAGVTFGPDSVIFHQMRLAGEDEPGPGGELALLRSVSAVTGACLALRKRVWLDAGGMDEINLAVACNDIDLCRRVAALGLRIVWTPFAELLHLESPSRGHSTTPEKADREASETMVFWAHHPEMFEKPDPFNNPQVHYKPHCVDFAQPPRAHPLRDAGAGDPPAPFAY